MKDPSPVESSCRYIRDPHGAKHMEGGLNKWKDVSCDFDNLFTVHTPSPVFHLAHSCLSVATSGSKYTFERNEERNESEDIAWSDSDSEQIAFDGKFSTWWIHGHCWYHLAKIDGEKCRLRSLWSFRLHLR